MNGNIITQDDRYKDEPQGTQEPDALEITGVAEEDVKTNHGNSITRVPEEDEIRNAQYKKINIPRRR